jgi:hypothetical protein
LQPIPVEATQPNNFIVNMPRDFFGSHTISPDAFDLSAWDYARGVSHARELREKLDGIPKIAFPNRAHEENPVTACAARVAVPEARFRPRKRRRVCTPVEHARRATSAQVRFDSECFEQSRHLHCARNCAKVSER